MRTSLLLPITLLVCAVTVIAQTAPTTTPGAPATAASTLTTPVSFDIRGSVKSGKMPLPGVTISATNSLTGKKTITSTDIEGNFQIQPSSRGRYVVKAELPAFAIATGEAVINPATPNAKIDLELVLLSRVPKTATDEAGAVQQALAGVLNGRGAQSLSLSGTGFQGDS